MTTKYDVNQIILLPFYVETIKVETDRVDPNDVSIGYKMQPAFNYRYFTGDGIKISENELEKAKDMED